MGLPLSQCRHCRNHYSDAHLAKWGRSLHLCTDPTCHEERRAVERRLGRDREARKLFRRGSPEDEFARLNGPKFVQISDGLAYPVGEGFYAITRTGHLERIHEDRRERARRASRKDDEVDARDIPPPRREKGKRSKSKPKGKRPIESRDRKRLARPNAEDVYYTILVENRAGKRGDVLGLPGAHETTIKRERAPFTQHRYETLTQTKARAGYWLSFWLRGTGRGLEEVLVLDRHGNEVDAQELLELYRTWARTHRGAP